MTEVSPQVSADRALALWGWQRETLVIDELEQLLADASARRDEHVSSLHDTGLTYRDIADVLGVSQARVGQIMARVKARKPQPKENH